MDKRRYVQRARAESAEATRRRILAAARATLERGPAGALRVEEVARAAGVARSTVYQLYGSRSGLFDALARHLRDEAGFEALVAASRLPDALENLRASQRAAVAVYAAMPDLARAMFTLAAIDPDAVAAVAAIEDGRRPGMVHLATALAAQGYLRDGVSVAEAIDILTVITSFQAFDELFTGSGLPPAVVADRLIAMAERSICRPDVPSGR
ncbi:MAG TPA: TetR family transcriptional regulator [Candidatus Limnocylindrales bacterium]